MRYIPAHIPLNQEFQHIISFQGMPLNEEFHAKQLVEQALGREGIATSEIKVGTNEKFCDKYDLSFCAVTDEIPEVK